MWACVCRGAVDGRQGWSVLLKEPAQWVELEGSDYVLDLMSDLELPADFPKHNSYFIISALEPARVRPNASMWDNAHAHTPARTRPHTPTHTPTHAGTHTNTEKKRFHEASQLLKWWLCDPGWTKTSRIKTIFRTHHMRWIFALLEEVSVSNLLALGPILFTTYASNYKNCLTFHCYADDTLIRLHFWGH